MKEGKKEERLSIEKLSFEETLLREHFFPFVKSNQTIKCVAWSVMEAFHPTSISIYEDDGLTDVTSSFVLRVFYFHSDRLLLLLVP